MRSETKVHDDTLKLKKLSDRSIKSFRRKHAQPKLKINKEKIFLALNAIREETQVELVKLPEKEVRNVIYLILF